MNPESKNTRAFVDLETVAALTSSKPELCLNSVTAGRYPITIQAERK